MTYCVGVLLNDGVVLASDSRTNAGVDNFATFSKMTVFERSDDRLIVLLSSGNLAGTQAVISVLRQRGELENDGSYNIWNARTMFDIANRARTLTAAGTETAATSSADHFTVAAVPAASCQRLSA